MAETITEQAAPSLESVQDMIFATRGLHVLDSFILQRLGPNLPPEALFSHGFVIAVPTTPLYNLPALNALLDPMPTSINGTGEHTPGKLAVDYSRIEVPHITYRQPIGEIAVNTTVTFDSSQILDNHVSATRWEHPVSRPFIRQIDLLFFPSSASAEINRAELIKGSFLATIKGWRNQRALKNSVKGRLHEF